MSVDRDKAVLDDTDIYELSKYADYADEAHITDLWPELETAAAALRDNREIVLPKNKQIVLAMRACYLLGIQRGGESYRNGVLAAMGEDEIEDSLPFKLENCCEMQAEEELSFITGEAVDKLLRKFNI